MRLIGWCLKCKRVRWVRVDFPGAAHGLCDECEDKR